MTKETSPPVSIGCVSPYRAHHHKQLPHPEETEKVISPAVTPLPPPADGLAHLSELPRLLHLELVVTDSYSITELAQHEEGSDRSDYALSALRVGLLSLRYARGQIDAESIRREGERLLSDLRQALELSRAEMNQALSSSLREYFDPAGGKFQERVERLIRQDGELEQVLRRQVGANDSEMVRSLTAVIGENSPFMRLLNPDEAGGLVARLRSSVGEILDAEKRQILAQFSLDDGQSALSRLVTELKASNGNLEQQLASEVSSVVEEFSLDKEDSALSRLMRKVEAAHATIAKEFSLDHESSALSRMTRSMGEAAEAIDRNLTLDEEQSALSRLRRELLGVLDRHEQQASSFQTEVKATLAEIRARREESLRSTAHGRNFEDAVWEFVQKEAQKAGDLAARTGTTTGAIRNCKVGDAVITLGEDTAAPGASIVVESKEDTSYDLRKAREECLTARRNRQAEIAVFILSKKTAPAGQEILCRHGSDIFVVWDAEDITSDIHVRAAMMVARALSIRNARARTEETADLDALDKSILELEREARRLGEIRKWTETIRSNSGKVLEEVAKMTEGVQKQIDCLRQTASALRGAVAVVG